MDEQDREGIAFRVMMDTEHGRLRRFRESRWFNPSAFRGAVLVGLVVLVVGSLITKPWEGGSTNPSGSTINKFNYGIETQNQTGGINEIVQTPVRGSGPTHMATPGDLRRYIETRPIWTGQLTFSSKALALAMREQTPTTGTRHALTLSGEGSVAFSAGTLVAEGDSVLEAERVVCLVGRIVGWNESGAKARGWGDDGELTEVKIAAPYSKRKVYAVMAEPIRAHYGEVVFARAVVVAVGYGLDSNALTAVVLLESMNHESEAAPHSAVSNTIRDFHTRNPHRNDG